MRKERPHYTWLLILLLGVVPLALLSSPDTTAIASQPRQQATTIYATTLTGSVVTVTPTTYSMTTTIGLGWNGVSFETTFTETMIETITGGTYTLTATGYVTIFASGPSASCPSNQYLDPNTQRCLPSFIKPIIETFAKLWNWLRCLFRHC
jgi:hypothetical protein